MYFPNQFPPRYLEVYQNNTDCSTETDKKMKVLVSLLVVAIAPWSIVTAKDTQPTCPCIDDGQYTYGGNPDLSCSGIRSWEGFRSKYCGFDEVRNACRVTCGDCCADDPAYTLAPFRSKRNCAWVAKKESRKEKLCDKFAGGNKMGKVHNHCPLTCGFCAPLFKVVDQLCADKDRNCGYWADKGECSKNSQYMLTNCISSCNVITPDCLTNDTTEGSPSECPTVSPAKSSTTVPIEALLNRDSRYATVYPRVMS